MTDKKKSTEYAGVYTGMFSNISPRELVLEARVKELEEKLIIEERKNLDLKERIEELETKIGWYKSYGKDDIDDE